MLQSIGLLYHIHILLNILWGKLFIPHIFVSWNLRSIYFLKQARPQPKFLMGIFDKLMDFAPSMLQENCLYNMFTVSHFASFNLWMTLTHTFCVPRYACSWWWCGICCVKVKDRHKVVRFTERIMINETVTSCHHEQLSGVNSGVYWDIVIWLTWVPPRTFDN